MRILETFLNMAKDLISYLESIAPEFNSRWGQMMYHLEPVRMVIGPVCKAEQTMTLGWTVRVVRLDFRVGHIMDPSSSPVVGIWIMNLLLEEVAASKFVVFYHSILILTTRNENIEVESDIALNVL